MMNYEVEILAGLWSAKTDETGQVAIVGEGWHALVLPTLPNAGTGATDSPENVSCETLGDTPPQADPVRYIDGMETHTTYTPVMSTEQLFTGLLDNITKSVLVSIETQLERMVAEAMSEHEVDIDSITSDYTFRSEVEDMVKGVLGEASWSVSYEG